MKTTATVRITDGVNVGHVQCFRRAADSETKPRDPVHAAEIGHG